MGKILVSIVGWSYYNKKDKIIGENSAVAVHFF